MSAVPNPSNLPLLSRTTDGSQDSNTNRPPETPQNRRHETPAELARSPDLLAIHVIRDSDTGGIVCHPKDESYESGAEDLRKRLVEAGGLVDWQNIFSNTSGCIAVETKSIDSTSLAETKNLHNSGVRLLQYTSLLRDSQRSVRFLQDIDAPHPGDITSGNSLESQLLRRECNNLLEEIERPEMARDMHNKQLKDVMNLAFSTVAIMDNTQMREDSRAVKQIAILTMVFLPASVAAGIFWMNIKSFDNCTEGQLWQYLATAASLTVLIIWIIEPPNRAPQGAI
ncbi:hypothetical protein AX16_010524 [Volvariella volvacea WC 439]|nr:hypothetical protein AX16_010524 [Volvariella volvacea WC 439]